MQKEGGALLWLEKNYTNYLGERNLSELELVRIFFLPFLKKLEFVRIGICQNQNLSELEFVRIEICQNWNLSEFIYTQNWNLSEFGNCQNRNFSELEFVRIGNCQNWNLSELAIISFEAKNAM